MRDPNRRPLYILCLIVLISGVGYGIISPIIPVYADELEASSIEDFHYTLWTVTVDEFVYGCLLLVITGVGVGLNSPAAMSLITETSPGKQKGTGMGVYGTISGTGFIAGPVLAGLLYAKDPAFPFWMAGAMAILSITFVHFFVQETGHKSQPVPAPPFEKRGHVRWLRHRSRHS